MEQDRYFPIFINLNGKHAVVFGGGIIATRRVDALLRFGANVTVIAPEVSGEIYALTKRYGKSELEKQLKVICDSYPHSGIPMADFVLSATDDPQADREIYRFCRENRIPVNVASDQGMCDFLFPALIEYEDIVMGVSSGGRDHKKVRRFSSHIRKFLNEYKENDNQK